MQLLIIRHARAEDAVAFAKTGHADDLRPLTIEGRKRMRRAAKGLRKIVEKIDLLGTSPVVRAIETAHIIAKEFEKSKLVELKQLSPGSSCGDLLGWIKLQPQDRTIALVGHEPLLGRFIGCMVTGQELSLGPLKRGCACLLSFEIGNVAPGAGSIQWLVTPGQLRGMAK